MGPFTGHGEPGDVNADGAAYGVGDGRPYRIQRALREDLCAKGACGLWVFDNINQQLLGDIEHSGDQIDGKKGGLPFSPSLRRLV